MRTAAPIEHKCQIESDYEKGGLVVRPRGTLDWATAPELHDHLRLHSDDRAVIVDLTAVVQSDAAGVGVLLVAAAEASELGHQLVVVVPDGSLADALDAVGLGSIIPMVPTLNEAWDRLTNR